jgi:hypothetical protein
MSHVFPEQPVGSNLDTLSIHCAILIHSYNLPVVNGVSLRILDHV